MLARVIQPHTPSNGRLPNVIVIGTIKGGTSALYHYLRQHPDVEMSREKELDFFFDPGILSHSPRGFERGAWHLGVHWYQQWFQTEKAVCGEASPNYSLGTYAEQIAARMAEVAPQARLIYLVRNPLERMRSHFLMAQKQPGADRHTFSDYVAQSDAMSISC